MLVLEGVTKRFGSKTAVNSVDLNLLPGERLCLMGSNGAGKTTVMRMVVGMALPTEGSVELLGKNPVEIPAIRRHLGYLPDKPYVYDKLTSREHFRLHAALYDLPFERILCNGVELLENLGMASALDQRVETMSFGMQRKLALTLTLAHRPDLVVLDEPLNGLDTDSADKMENLLRLYAEEDQAIILSTHSVEFAERFASRIGVMQAGRLTSHVPPGGADAQWIRSLLTPDMKRTGDSDQLNERT